MSVLLLAGISVAAIVVFLMIIPAMFRTVVPTNDVHIVQSGNVTTSYGRGQASNVYYAWPSWVPKFGVKVSIFPMSVFDLNLKDYPGYDKDRVPFLVDIMAFFRISDPNMAAERIHNFAALQEQLMGILQGAVRSILAKYPLNEVLEGRSQFGDQFTQDVTNQLIQWGVTTVKSIELMDIRDEAGSKAIANIMEKQKSFIERESRVAVAANHQAAQEAEIAAQRQVDLAAQEAAQQVGIRKAAQERDVGIAREQAAQQVKEQAKITAEKDMAVKQVADTRSAEIAKQVKITQADQDKQSAILAAEAALKTAQLTAQGVQAQGEAKAAAERALQLAPISAQIELAKEIGSNEGYQKYLLGLRQIEASQIVGVEQAKALTEADIKVIANSGDVVSGVTKAMDLFTSKGGTQLGGMLEALKQTDVGRSVIDAVTSKSNGSAPVAEKTRKIKET